MSNLLFLAQETVNNTGNGAVWFAGGTFAVFMIILLIASIFWIWMLIDCLTSSLPSTEKLIWVLVIFFLHVIGALLYFIIGRPGRTGRTRMA